MKLLKSTLAILLMAIGINKIFAQANPEAIYAANIHSVRFHLNGDQATMPVYKLNSADKLELHFDDMDANIKSYYYTYQLCDYNWQPINLSSFDFIKGFTQQRISIYRMSSISFTRYTHYQAMLPDANCMPSRSGNYLLKVFLNGDTSTTVFTRAMLVLNPKATVSAQMLQPFTPNVFRTHQRIRFSVNIDGLNAFNASQQIKVKVLQNFRWDNAMGNIPPTFVRGNTLEYNNESSFVFAGGKEWRWLDLRSMRLLSDRVERAENTKTSFNLFMKPDADRSAQKYVYYQDLNGLYQILTYESINPFWQADYATVNFLYLPPGGAAYPDKDVYLFGQLTDYKLNQSAKLEFNPEKGVYEGKQFLKQGYYSYGYQLVDKKNAAVFKDTDGNYWETENNYTILVYYKGFADQSDQLIGIASLSTRTDRPGFTF
jgi:hypothetical protein